MFHLTIDDQYRKMPWDELDAVVFDVGNVLLTFSPEKLLAELFPDDAPLREKLIQRMFRSPYWVELDRGVLEGEDAVNAMAGFETDLRPAVRKVLEHRIYLHEIIPEGMETLRACKARGKKAYVLSNYQDYAFQHALDYHKFFSEFDGMVISGQLQLVKPDPAIYRHLTDKYGLNPARTLFIDDNPGNVEAAMHEGWQGLCLNVPGKLHDFISE